MKPIRILFVEDNDDLRKAITELLEDDGREILGCSNAESALDEFNAQPFDMLITDVSLPGMSGVDLARTALAARPDLWVVLCSGYAFPKDMTSWGPNVRALLKPFELEDIERVMEQVTQDVRGNAA
jgi:two-component system cell cycle response regulator CpdR